MSSYLGGQVIVRSRDFRVVESLKEWYWTCKRELSRPNSPSYSIALCVFTLLEILIRERKVETGRNSTAVTRLRQRLGDRFDSRTFEQACAMVAQRNKPSLN